MSVVMGAMRGVIAGDGPPLRRLAQRAPAARAALEHPRGHCRIAAVAAVVQGLFFQNLEAQLALELARGGMAPTTCGSRPRGVSGRRRRASALCLMPMACSAPAPGDRRRSLKRGHARSGVAGPHGLSYAPMLAALAGKAPAQDGDGEVIPPRTEGFDMAVATSHLNNRSAIRRRGAKSRPKKLLQVPPSAPPCSPSPPPGQSPEQSPDDQMKEEPTPLDGGEESGVRSAYGMRATKGCADERLGFRGRRGPGCTSGPGHHSGFGLLRLLRMLIAPRQPDGIRIRTLATTRAR